MAVPDLRLPADLVAFLLAGRRLEHEADAPQAGRARLRSLRELELGELPVDMAEWAHLEEDDEAPLEDDPHLDEDGYYVVPAVDLIASITGDYPPQGILAWLPELEQFCTFDSGHLDLLLFGDATWRDIVREPVRYLDAQWSNDPPGVYLSPWLHGFEWREGSPW